ncbi:acyl carrier protein phosphodiesterase [Lewinella aquimaris]|uniref:Acyl carrier protein phosphodiesterase n=1 Tax=Neolewinella aquimaris TaxID=1835722 RepID=A0A840E9S5_9BACT|nr:ACP phosphodiesterase [Neolewinella aquimaris]MBB4077776.1 acyl carrier protein phosphodiesterase [Neolewinella aquimaris]
MNFLAHLTLSHFSADLQVGNYLGDLLRGKEVAQLREGIHRGVLMHRAIDRLTDADADVRAVNRLLRSRHGRYAGVISDIAFDHYLCRNWVLLGPVPFALFTRTTYRNLLAAREEMPERARRYVNGMVEDDWLSLYATADGMHKVFERLLPRLSRPEKLAGVEESLQEYDAAINRALLLLFPRLQSLAESYREQPPSP